MVQYKSLDAWSKQFGASGDGGHHHHAHHCVLMRPMLRGKKIRSCRRNVKMSHDVTKCRTAVTRAHLAASTLDQKGGENDALRHDITIFT